MLTARQYEAGEVIFREKDTGETAYVIERGRVEVLKTLEGKDLHIAYIGPGEPFGEMSMIDEKPRSATVVAVEPTVVRELHRDQFLETVQTQPKIAISLLKILFERLREADATILQLYRSYPELVKRPRVRTPDGPPESGVVYLDGLTPEANNVLPEVPFRIAKFPFRIGRHSTDPLANNDLSIFDAPPIRLSRHHLSFVREGGRIGVVDRGSRLGSLLDGNRLGGEGGSLDIIFFTENEGTLVLGDELSPFKFKVTIKDS
jgi:CRP-like cAMP-binding protein